MNENKNNSIKLPSKSIHMTNNEVHIEITFLEEQPKDDIKEAIVKILTTQFHNKVLE